MKDKLFLTLSEHKHQGIIQIVLAMIKISCKMIVLQNEEKAKETLNFQIMEEDGSIRNANALKNLLM